MKKWNYLFMAMGVAMAMTACSDDMDLSENSGVNPEENVDQVFMQFALELPTASRSTTQVGGGSDAGVEIGQNKENTVSDVLVVITDGTAGDTYDNYITKSHVQTPASAGNNTYVVPFSSTALANYAGKLVNVYVFCNPTSDLTATTTTSIDVDETYKLSSATDATIWTDNKFLMTNADNNYSETLPESFNNYKVESSPFNIGTINVERAAARFDYKSTVANETYTLMGEDSDPEVTVTLTDMALVNMSQEFYYLRRVSADGTNTSATIGGAETNTNYVVDTDATWKSSYGDATSDEASHFYYVYNPNNTSDITWTSISSLTTEDKDESWNSGENESTSKDGYKIWRYATENTIPAAVANQKKGITTGVVFKGVINPVKEGTIKTAMDAKSTVYVYNDIMYGTWNDVKTAASSDPVLKLAYDKVGETENKTTAVANGFTVFEPTSTDENGKYEVLYYYWNRHNDNNNDGSMGPMEFGVVRNNVYKLSVTDVHKFGHPTNPDHDPDPEDPEDPDEDSNVYFSVAVQVLPWVVRVNDIEF